MINEDFLTEFTKCEAVLARQRAQLEQRIAEVLSERRLEVQFVSGRVKSVESLRRKLGRPDKTYGGLWDVTDLVGLRIATYFEDAIEEVARAIEAAFEIDFTHSAEKDRFNEQGRFGYRSLHYICRFPEEAELPPKARFEIQVRTALQHAWAEVEHDLGYKADGAVPEGARRRFSRIASLLEIADQEFVSVRKELAAYRASAEERLRDPGRSFPLDAVTLLPVAHDPLTADADRAIGELLGKPLSDELFFPEYLVRMLRHVGLVTTSDVLQALSVHRDAVRTTVGPYFDFARSTWASAAPAVESVARGYSLFFLAHVVILRDSTLELAKVGRLSKLYAELDYPEDEAAAQRVASGLVAALRPHL